MNKKMGAPIAAMILILGLTLEAIFLFSSKELAIEVFAILGFVFTPVVFAYIIGDAIERKGE